MILWFVPEYLGSGDFLRAANRARQPNPDSAAFAAFPFLEVFRRSASVLTAPVYVGGVDRGRHRASRDRSKGIALAMAAVSTVLMISVGADDPGRLRGQPALHRAAGRLRLRARRRRLGVARQGRGHEDSGRSRPARSRVLIAAGWAPFVISDIKELDRAA